MAYFGKEEKDLRKEKLVKESEMLGEVLEQREQRRRINLVVGVKLQEDWSSN